MMCPLKNVDISPHTIKAHVSRSEWECVVALFEKVLFIACWRRGQKRAMEVHDAYAKWSGGSCTL